jgi:hypothetical protein
LSLSLFVGTEKNCQLTRAVVGTANTTLAERGRDLLRIELALHSRPSFTIASAWGCTLAGCMRGPRALAIRLKPDRTSPRQSTDAAANWPTMKKSVSVIIACLNEEENLEGTYGIPGA